MKDDNVLRYTLRVDKNLFKKFRYVAEYNGRSANKELIQLMKEVVETFENKHEKIDIISDEI